MQSLRPCPLFPVWGQGQPRALASIGVRLLEHRSQLRRRPVTLRAAGPAVASAGLHPAQLDDVARAYRGDGTRLNGLEQRLIVDVRCGG